MQKGCKQQTAWFSVYSPLGLPESKDILEKQTLQAYVFENKHSFGTCKDMD